MMLSWRVWSISSPVSTAGEISLLEEASPKKLA